MRSTLAIALACWVAAVPASARESNGTAAAKVLYAQGDAAAKAGKPSEAAAAFRKAFEADPDFVDAHQRFIESTQRTDTSEGRTESAARLRELYTQWATQQPTRAAYQWALGFLSPEADKADVFFRAALAIDPRFARAHYLLAKNADQRGEFAAQREHLKAAVDANPDEPRYLMAYAQAFKRTDLPRFRELAQSVADRFPNTPAAAEASYKIADASLNPERRARLERMRTTYPPDKFGYGGTAMYDLYDEVTTPTEALSIAREMAKAMPASKSWARRVELQQAMESASALVTARRFAEALDVLAKTERPSGSHGATWALLKAEAAAGAGQTEDAYRSLVESIAVEPDDRVQAGLAKYGTAMSKSPRDVDADVWRARDAKAKPAADFAITADRGASPVKLADYRGKVLLLSFWFPS